MWWWSQFCLTNSLRPIGVFFEEDDRRNTEREEVCIHIQKIAIAKKHSLSIRKTTIPRLSFFFFIFTVGQRKIFCWLAKLDPNYWPHSSNDLTSTHNNNTHTHTEKWKDMPLLVSSFCLGEKGDLQKNNNTCVTQ